jgi:TetR/AcrR family transcriptional regulator
MAPRRTEEIDAGGGRERLLKAALHLFASKGYAATSVRDIVNAAGVTAPTLYHHFGNKEGIFLAILQAGLARVEAARQEVLAAGGSAAVRIMRLGRSLVALRHEFADLVWAIGRMVLGPPPTGLPIDLGKLDREKTRPFEQLVEEGIATGEFRPCAPRHVAMALVGAVEITCRSRMFDPGSGGSETALDGMLAVILSGIARSGAE